MKQPTHFRLSQEALHVLDTQARVHGLTRTAMLELILRNWSQEHGEHIALRWPPPLALPVPERRHDD